jgi:hypothetical protein
MKSMFYEHKHSLVFVCLILVGIWFVAFLGVLLIK